MSSEVFSSLLSDFLLEAAERLGRLEELLLTVAEGGDIGPAGVDEVKLQLHTLKGNSGLVGLQPLQSLAHDLEDLADTLGTPTPEIDELLQGVDRFRQLLQQSAGEGTAARGAGAAERGAAPGGVRVAFSTLDALVDLIGEMVIHRNHLADALLRHRAELREAGLRPEVLETVQRASDLLAGSFDRLREGVMGLRMVPLRTQFRSLARIVHDESARAGKDVRFETHGGETPLDKALLEVTSEALGHLVRNAIVHGLESPQERRRLGKGEGLVRLAAEADAREVRIDVLDDGGGIPRERILAAAARRGRTLAPGEDPLSLLFLPGFSTLQSADLSAGRGVGLAAVREAVARSGGRVEVYSEEGVGTLFRLRLPLSVSITRVLLLASDGEDYVLPLAAVVESVELTPAKVNEINGALVLTWRSELVPLLDLGECFGTSRARRRAGHAVVIEARGSLRALAVERVLGIREVVVRGLDPLAGEPPGIAGTTILGDGKPVLILDPSGLMDLSPFARQPGGMAGRTP